VVCGNTTKCYYFPKHNTTTREAGKIRYATKRYDLEISELIIDEAVENGDE